MIARAFAPVLAPVLASLYLAAPLMAAPAALGGMPEVSELGAETTASKGPVVGQPAPDFEARDINGDLVRLSDLKGKVVMLEWTNHLCPYVKKHYGSGNMQKTQRALTEDGVTWISIVSSAPKKQGHITAEEGKKLTVARGTYINNLILDPKGAIGRAYRARTTPQMFLIDEDGILRYQGAIDDKPSSRLSSLEGATNYALNAWQSVKAGQDPTPATTKPYGCSVKY